MSPLVPVTSLLLEQLNKMAKKEHSYKIFHEHIVLCRQFKTTLSFCGSVSKNWLQKYKITPNQKHSKQCIMSI